MFQHVGWICVDTKGASLFQFGLAVATREKAHRQRSAATRGKHVPNAIADYNAVFHWNSQLPGRTNEYIGRRLGLGNIIASDNHCLNRNSKPL